MSHVSEQMNGFFPILPLSFELTIYWKRATGLELAFSFDELYSYSVWDYKYM